MGIACDNSDKVGWLYWCADDSASLYWFSQYIFPFSKFFAAQLVEQAFIRKKAASPLYKSLE
jgi:hypothetical protein